MTCIEARRRRVKGLDRPHGTQCRGILVAAMGQRDSLTGAPGTAAPGASGKVTGTIGTAAPASSTGTAGTIRTTAFILTSTGNGNGNGTLTLTMSQVFDPAVFQQALTQDGIPAVVGKDDTFCASSPAAPDPASIGVLSVAPPFKLARQGMTGVVPGAPRPGDPDKLIADTKMVINPAKIPAGTELFFSYSSTGHTVYTALVDKDSCTCGSGQPPTS